MSFAGLAGTLLAAAMLATAAAVIVIYLLRPAPKLQPVSNVGFWLRAMQRSRPRLLWSHRLPLLALLVSLAVALLLVAEIADPRFGSGVQGTTVVVIDAGRTMAARNGAGRRLDEARARLRALVQQATLSGRVAVVRAGVHASVLVPLSGSPGDVERALAGLACDDGGADLAEALALAAQMVRQSGQQGRVVLLSDRAPPTSLGGAGKERDKVPVDFQPVGHRGESVAITSLGVRRVPSALGEYSVFCEVQNFSARRAHARLVLRDRAVVLSEEDLDLAPGATMTHHAQGFSSVQGEVQASLVDLRLAGARDAWDTDDRAWAAVEALVPTRVLLVSPGNRHLEQALAANPALDVERIEPAALDALRAARDGLARWDVLVLDRVVALPGLEHPAQFLVAPAPEARDAEVLRQVPVTGVAAEHPVMQGVRFDQVHVLEAHPLRAAPDDRVLVRSGAAPLVLARERGGTRLVAMGFETSATDLVQRIAFPLFMHHAMVWLAHREQAYRSYLRPGEAIRVARASSVVLLPSGAGRTPTAGGYRDTGRAGMYHVGPQAVAVSGVDETGPLPAPPGPRGAVHASSRLPRLSLLVAAGLLVLLLLEWLLVQRGRLP